MSNKSKKAKKLAQKAVATANNSDNTEKIETATSPVNVVGQESPIIGAEVTAEKQETAEEPVKNEFPAEAGADVPTPDKVRKDEKTGTVTIEKVIKEKKIAEAKPEPPYVPFGTEIPSRIQEAFIGVPDVDKQIAKLLVKFDFGKKEETVNINPENIDTYTLFTTWYDVMKGDLYRPALGVFNHFIANIKDYAGTTNTFPSAKTIEKWCALKVEKDLFEGVGSWSELLAKLAEHKVDTKVFFRAWRDFNSMYRQGRNVLDFYFPNTEGYKLGDVLMVNNKQAQYSSVGVVVYTPAGFLHLVTPHGYMTIVQGTGLRKINTEDLPTETVEILQKSFNASFEATSDVTAMVSKYVARQIARAAEKEYRENEMQGVYDSLMSETFSVAKTCFTHVPAVLDKKTKAIVTPETLDITKPIKTDAEIVAIFRAFRQTTLDKKLSREMRDNLNTEIRKYRQPSEDRLHEIEVQVRKAAKEAAEKAKAEVKAQLEGAVASTDDKKAIKDLKK